MSIGGLRNIAGISELTKEGIIQASKQSKKLGIRGRLEGGVKLVADGRSRRRHLRAHRLFVAAKRDAVVAGAEAEQKLGVQLPPRVSRPVSL